MSIDIQQINCRLSGIGDETRLEIASKLNKFKFPLIVILSIIICIYAYEKLAKDVTASIFVSFFSSLIIIVFIIQIIAPSTEKIFFIIIKKLYPSSFEKNTIIEILEYLDVPNSTFGKFTESAINNLKDIFNRISENNINATMRKTLLRLLYEFSMAYFKTRRGSRFDVDPDPRFTIKDYGIMSAKLMKLDELAPKYKGITANGPFDKFNKFVTRDFKKFIEPLDLRLILLSVIIAIVFILTKDYIPQNGKLYQIGGVALALYLLLNYPPLKWRGSARRACLARR